MQNILIIINAPPYGSERCLSALADLPLIPGTAIGTLVELGQATLVADKVITF